MRPWLGGVGLGRVLGIPVRLDLSFIAGLGVVALSRELWAPAVTGAAALGWSGAFAVAFFGCVLAHELAHASWPGRSGCRRPRSGCSCSAGWPA